MFPQTFSKLLERRHQQNRSNIQKPQEHEFCSISLHFRLWAKLGKFCGFFPVLNEDLDCHHNQSDTCPPKKCPYLSFYFILSISIFLFFSTSILQPLQLYISVYMEDGEIKLVSTDKFALQVFLTCVHVIRGVAPFFSLVRIGQIMSAIKTMTNYDQRFKTVKSTVKFHDFWIAILFLGSVAVLVSNYIVTETDFVEAITSDDDPIFPLSYFLTQSKLITTIFVEAGQTYAEFAICFVVALMRFISKFVEDRMKRLEEEIKNLLHCAVENKELCPFKNLKKSLNHVYCVSNLDREDLEIKKNAKKEILSQRGDMRLCAKLQDLVTLLEIFNRTFQGYILGFFIFTLILVIVSLYMLIVVIRMASVLGGFFFLKKTKVARGFNALIITGTHSVFRMILLINVGERIQNAGKSLLATVSLLDSTKLAVLTPNLGTPEATSLPGTRKSDDVEYSLRVINEMRWMLHGIDFSVKPWNIFVLNRQIMVSVLGSVITFVVVLTQFRVGDPFMSEEMVTPEDHYQSLR